MAYMTTQVSDKPILLTCINGPIVFSDCKEVWDQVDQAILAQEEGMIYWIIDLSMMMMSYSDLIRMVEANYQGRPGTITDNRVYPMVVGTQEVMQPIHEIVKDRHLSGSSKMDIPFFHSVEDALLFVGLFCA